MASGEGPLEDALPPPQGFATAQGLAFTPHGLLTLGAQGLDLS